MVWKYIQQFGSVWCVRHWLSSDTKEERLRWTDCLNEALASLRAWHADALRPVRHHQQPPATAAAVHWAVSCCISARLSAKLPTLLTLLFSCNVHNIKSLLSFVCCLTLTFVNIVYHCFVYSCIFSMFIYCKSCNLSALFSVLAKRLSGKRVSKMAYFSGMLNLNSVNHLP